MLLFYTFKKLQRKPSSVYWLSITLAIALFVVIYLLAHLYPIFRRSLLYFEYFLILGLNIIFLALGRQHRTYLQKQLLFKPIVLVEISAYLSSLLLAIYLALEGFGVFSLVNLTLLASAIECKLSHYSA